MPEIAPVDGVRVCECVIDEKKVMNERKYR